jgi:hypothetical protein
MNGLTPAQAETLRTLAREMVNAQVQATATRLTTGLVDVNVSAAAGEASDRFHQWIDEHTHGGQK